MGGVESPPVSSMREAKVRATHGKILMIPIGWGVFNEALTSMVWGCVSTKLTNRLSSSITDFSLNFDMILATSDMIIRAAHTSESLDSLATARAILSECSVLLSFTVCIGTTR